MESDLTITVVSDAATPAVEALKQSISPEKIKRAVGAACVLLTQDHLRGLGPNKMGWPSTGFYDGAARGTTWDDTPDGVRIAVDNAEHPGAMRQRFHGGPIVAKEHLLTIPARPEFYGHSATEFTNLRLAIFKSGAMALVIGKGGVGRVNFETGRERNVKGAGVRSESMVAFWLRERVDQDADPGVIPSEDEYAETAIGAVMELVEGADDV